MPFDEEWTVSTAAGAGGEPGWRGKQMPIAAEPAGQRAFPGADVAASGIRLDGVEFATLSERLGEYFGVTRGVLVVRAGPDAPFGLQDGDVILEIDGRAPTSAQHAGRILRSYRPGEPVRLQLQRDRKPVTIAFVVPGG